MEKHYCDVCEKELIPYNHAYSPFEPGNGNLFINSIKIDIKLDYYKRASDYHDKKTEFEVCSKKCLDKKLTEVLKI